MEVEKTIGPAPFPTPEPPTTAGDAQTDAAAQTADAASDAGARDAGRPEAGASK